MGAGRWSGCPIGDPTPGTGQGHLRYTGDTMLEHALTAPRGESLSPSQVTRFLQEALTGRFTGHRVLALIPDRTRTLPLPHLFQAAARSLADAAQVDFLVALGTHPPLAPDEIDRLLGVSREERRSRYPGVRIYNHAYDDPGSLVRLGELSPQQIRDLAGTSWHHSLDRRIPITINRRILEYDHLIILGPTFPHEVVGFSGGVKYLFPGISGPEMIDATHWLGALTGVQDTIGVKDTPIRRMIRAAAEHVPVPVSLLALVVEDQVSGMFYGGPDSAWSEAADLSQERHIEIKGRTFSRVLSRAPAMYDELWTAAKAMYKVEGVVEDGGELILYAPHLETISTTHGALIKQLGYHVMPYFLNQWDRFKDFPLAVLAHSTHLRGEGSLQNGFEKPRIQVTLASRIPPEVCRDLNLGCRDPNSIHEESWMGREDEGVLFVPRAGERLYRVDGS